MTWVLLAIGSAALYGAANVLDNFFANRVFRNPLVIHFYSAAASIIFLPIIFIWQRPALPPADLIPALLIVGFVDLLVLYPYYRALQNDDTSVVSSLFSLGKVFIPVLAYLAVKEVLSPMQYFGFLMVVFASAAVTMQKGKILRFRKSLWYMALSAFMLAIEATTYKYVFERVDWVTGFTWSLISALGVIFITVGIISPFRKLGFSLARFRGVAHLFVIEELITFGAFVAVTYAISIAPVSLVHGVGSVQPFFILLYALVFKRWFPNMFKEDIARGSVIKKVALFAVTLIGVALIVR
ncbi:DMT family transporter [Candidatus Uhrbacteria bacterium]|nr:DMT family transporter [Candidatus Uhrbacteria bacterium]